MKKFSLKTGALWSLASLGFALPLTIPTPIHAAIPGGQLNDQELLAVTEALSAIKAYTEQIRAVTGDLFTRTTPFSQDFATLTRLRDEIVTIHNRIHRTGSPLAQATLSTLKGIAYHLSEAQKRWIITLQSRSLITMGKTEGFMLRRYADCIRFLRGAKQGNGYTGDGLLGCLEVIGSPTLRTDAQTILTNAEFIFHYSQATHTPKLTLAKHLIKYKGFHPKIIKQIAWLFG